MNIALYNVVYILWGHLCHPVAFPCGSITNKNVLTSEINTIFFIKHIGNAKVAGMETDLNLKPGEFNTAMSIFYVGYILGEVPSNMAVSFIFRQYFKLSLSACYRIRIMTICDRVFFLANNNLFIFWHEYNYSWSGSVQEFGSQQLCLYGGRSWLPWPLSKQQVLFLPHASFWDWLNR